MKKILISGIFGILLFTTGFSQVRYFNWKDSVINSCEQTYITGDLIHVKKYVFFINTRDKITKLYRVDSIGNCEPVPDLKASPLPTTRLCYGMSINKIFFVDNRNKVQTLNPDSFEIMDVTGADSARGDGLVFGEGINELYYAKTNGKIGHSQWDGKWKTITINLLIPHPPKYSSRFVYHSYKLIYVDIDSKLRMLYYDKPTEQWITWIVNPKAPDARGDCLVTGQVDELFYALKDSKNEYKDGRIVHIHWSNTKTPPMYLFEIIDYAETAKPGSTMAYGENTLFYVNKNQNLNILSWQQDNCIWANEILSSTFINYNSHPIVYGDSGIYAINAESGKIHKLVSGITSDFNFVYLKGRKFFHKNISFYPKILNYAMNVYFTNQKGNWEVYFGPNNSQIMADSASLLCNKESAFRYLKRDLDEIKNLGFNAIRFFAMAFPSNDELTIRGINNNNGDCIDDNQSLSDDSFRLALLNALDTVLQTIDSAGLKAIIVTGGLNTQLSLYEPYYY